MSEIYHYHYILYMLLYMLIRSRAFSINVVLILFVHDNENLFSTVSILYANSIRIVLAKVEQHIYQVVYPR